MRRIEACPVCSGTHFTLLVTAIDHTVSQEEFSIVRCNECDLAITHPQPDSKNLERYYQSEDYISHSNRARSLLDITYQVAKYFTLRWKVSLVKKYSLTQSQRVLDYGCGVGSFIDTLKKNNIETVGVEPSEKARSIAKSKGLSVHDKLSFNDKQYTTITLWHVLEHIPNLNDVLSSLYNALDNQGTIFIAVPNYESPDSQRYKSNWAGLDVPRHLWHFSKRNIAMLLTANGFQLKQIVPMKLDAFYVSILSSKYENKNQSFMNVLRGIINGLRSNLDAGENNHSSLIYIARKK
jgi:2-polyprenyl-3-methyl-5-hydroxy-6-metoxy-1,4-benzoquinol methylase